ncbi:hypothetical protein QBC42DRAFT_343945 [Cladorrhinum samala]|uniref:Uncharacterized protein n=1 Tax=Cladorrhinum samala TaxID=585594 RepID=A0AAV9HX46_9PEZI|nr:hypothetical protein QBC42DRAFT_343945 [Cladorrhinum samala]
MKFSFVSLLTLATAAAAAPSAVEGRAVTLIDLWADRDFLGLKFTGSADVGQCKNLPSNFNDLVTSGKARSGYRCTVWVDKDCKGTGFSFVSNPKIDSWIDNKASSWKCVKV